MKKLGFILVYIVLGIIAIGVRFTLKAESDSTYYMSIINQFAGFVTVVTVLINVLDKMIQKIKGKKQSYKRLRKFIFFSLIIMVGYWFCIKHCYHIYSEILLNDIVTICTLVIALTSELYENILLAIFYKG